MRIKDKARFAIGVVDIILSVTGAIICITQHRTSGLSIVGLTFGCGIANIIYGIETKAQRQKREEKLKAMAKMLGWDKKGDENDD